MDIKFSIIIPVYNVENYLRQCVDSILESKYIDIEILLINDGSTDSSPQICEEYSKKDNRVKVLHQQNSGQSSARNLGIKEAAGDYIMFLDSDDYIISDIFSLVHSKLTNKKIDLVLYDYRYENCITHAVYKSGLRYDDIKDEKYTGEKLLNQLLTKSPLFDWYPWQFLIRREFMINNNLIFEEGLLYEDIELVPQIIAKANSVILMNVPVINYRINRNGATTQVIKLKPELDRLDIASKKIEWVNTDINMPELREKLSSNFGAMFFTSLIKYFYVDKEDRKILRKKIKMESNIGRYVKLKKYKVIYGFYKIFGVTITARILYLRSKIRRS